MSLFAWISLGSSITCFSLGILVYLFDRKSILNKLFALTSFAAFFYSFTIVLMWLASDSQNSILWHKMGTMWPFFVVLVLHFALVFTKSNWLKNKRNYLLLYLPAVAFWIIDLFTDIINEPPVLRYWGYNNVASGSWVYLVSTIWAALLPILSFLLCLKYYCQTKEPEQKQQRKYVAVGFAIPIFAYIITNMLTRSLNIDFPNLGIVSTLFFSILVGYAVAKHDLFIFDSALTAENILTIMPDSIILADMNDNILKVNERLTNFVEYSENELIGQSINKLIPKTDSYYEFSKKLKKEKVVRNYSLILNTKSGQIHHVLFSGSTVQSRSGHAVGIVVIIHDITDIKAMEERLVKAERLASIGELARQLGHDIRNPLTGLKNSVYILRKKNNRINEMQRDEILDLMDDAIEDSNRIVLSLIDYSDELHLQPEQCTPRLLVMRSLDGLKIPERIKLQNKVSDQTKLFLDSVKIEKVFKCIIRNALEAMPEKGLLKIESAVKDSEIEISFTDSGTGIPDTVLAKIFSPLVTTKAKGMGMSLAICKRIVDAHGGRISVNSTVGEGTIFTVNLPFELSKKDCNS